MSPTIAEKYATLVFLFIGLLSFSQELVFEENSEGTLLRENGQPRFFYRTTPAKENLQFSRANYVHPVYGLSGEILTEDFPDDHPHHHGIFWSWHQLYAEGKRIADPWLNEGISYEVLRTSTDVKKEKAAIQAEVLWIQTSGNKAIVKEILDISFERLNEDVFTILFEISMIALTDGVAIGGSEDEKGYGGFSARFILPEDISFHSVNGKIEPDVLPVQAGPWMNLKGNFDGSGTNSMGIVIMGEPEKLPSFRGWILRSADSMQNMAFPGSSPVSISQVEPLTIRNQIVVHRNLSEEKIREIYNEFIKK